MPDEPVPMTPARSPVKSTPSSGQLPVWYVWPRNESSPGNSGIRPTDRLPTAMMQCRAVTRSPRSVSITQCADGSW